MDRSSAAGRGSFTDVSLDSLSDAPRDGARFSGLGPSIEVLDFVGPVTETHATAPGARGNADSTL